MWVGVDFRNISTNNFFLRLPKGVNFFFFGFILFVSLVESFSTLDIRYWGLVTGGAVLDGNVFCVHFFCLVAREAARDRCGLSRMIRIYPLLVFFGGFFFSRREWAGTGLVSMITLQCGRHLLVWQFPSLFRYLLQFPVYYIVLTC